MDRNQKGFLILLFLVSPFLGVIKLFKIKDEKTLTFFGTLFFGLVGSLFVYIDGTDGHSHLMNAKQYYTDMSLTEFFAKSYEILTFSSTESSSDIYMHIISFLSTSMLQSSSFLHVFTGLVLGYFFTKSVLLILKDHLKTKKGYILLGFIVLFLMIRSIGALNSIRMWTGMWILFYGTYSYAINKEKKYLFIILFSILVHFSYVIILIPVIIAFILKKQKIIIVLFYILSFFTTASFSIFEAYIPKSDLIQNRQSTYTIDSKDKVKRFKQNSANYQQELDDSNFYKNFGSAIYTNYSIVGLSLILLLFYLKKENNINFNFLLATGVFLYAFGNLVAFAPELQGRSKIIASTFILAAAIHLQFTMKVDLVSQKTKRLVNIGFALFLISSIPMFLFQISYIFQSFSFFLLFLPQISWLLGDQDSSLRSIIGLLID